MKHQPDCAAIVLAAGASTRLGEPKQLVSYLGESLLRRSVRMATAAGCAPVIVVLGFEAARMMLEIADLDAMPVENIEWRTGMASSLRCGLKAVIDSDLQLDMALLMVCDQPFIETALLTELIGRAALRGAPVAACSYAGALGIPAVFARRTWPQLLALTGDEGARRILAQCENVAAVEFKEGVIDVDTPEDIIGLEDRRQPKP